MDRDREHFVVTRVTSALIPLVLALVLYRIIQISFNLVLIYIDLGVVLISLWLLLSALSLVRVPSFWLRLEEWLGLREEKNRYLKLFGLALSVLGLEIVIQNPDSWLYLTLLFIASFGAGFAFSKWKGRRSGPGSDKN